MPRTLLSGTPFYEYVGRTGLSEEYKAASSYICSMKFMHPNISDEETIPSLMTINCAYVIKMMIEDGYIETCMMLFRNHMIVASSDMHNVSDSHGNVLYHYMALFGVEEEQIRRIHAYGLEEYIKENDTKSSATIEELLNVFGSSPIDIISNKRRIYS